jgi:UDP-2,3-diacylglucosamine pyrophosphatase LpxH
MSTSIVISDLHLGSPVSQTNLLSEFLAGEFDRLILNGDIVDSLNFTRFRAEDWLIFRRLRWIARQRELILLRGNHDVAQRHPSGAGALDVLAELLGTRLREEYELRVGGQTYLVLHGDQFDDSMNLTWLGDLIDWGYRQLQRLSRPLALRLKGRLKHFGGIIRTVRDGAVGYAARKGYAGVITGHTHFWDDARVDGVHYLNSGCWVDWPCSYVRVENGTARVEHWGDRAIPFAHDTPVRRPQEERGHERAGRRGILATCEAGLGG